MLHSCSITKPHCGLWASERCDPVLSETVHHEPHRAGIYSRAAIHKVLLSKAKAQKRVKHIKARKNPHIIRWVTAAYIPTALRSENNQRRPDTRDVCWAWRETHGGAGKRLQRLMRSDDRSAWPYCSRKICEPFIRPGASWTNTAPSWHSRILGS